MYFLERSKDTQLPWSEAPEQERSKAFALLCQPLGCPPGRRTQAVTGLGAAKAGGSPSESRSLLKC